MFLLKVSLSISVFFYLPRPSASCYTVNIHRSFAFVFLCRSESTEGNFIQPAPLWQQRTTKECTKTPTIYVNVDSPNLGFPYFDFLGRASYISVLHSSFFIFWRPPTLYWRSTAPFCALVLRKREPQHVGVLCGSDDHKRGPCRQGLFQEANQLSSNAWGTVKKFFRTLS